MSDKLQSASARSFPLPDITALALHGRDCIAFAQAQFMSDVASLADGQWQWSGWLTPKGRVLALFAVLRHTSERLDLIVLDADAEALATSLKRYVFRSKVAVEVRDDLPAHGTLAAPAQAHGAQAAIEVTGVELDFGTATQPRTLTLAPSVSGSNVDAARLLQWRNVDLAHGLPRLDAGQREQWTPQQLSLERLRAFSVSKGCYPGQEIVARTHFLGQAKRVAVAVCGVGAALPGQDVTADGQTLGRLASVAGDLGLAVLPLERPASDLQVDGRPVIEVPLREGLAR